MAVFYVGVDAHVKFRDFTFNGIRIIRLGAGWSRFTHYMQYSVAVGSRPEVDSHVISGICTEYGRLSLISLNNFVILA